jgi:pyruvate/2-oxoglutarate dehydrogenase complex dihydrolipoamide acyltransferase (E2) component
MKEYLALLFNSSGPQRAILKKWLLREGQEVVAQQKLFTYLDGGAEKNFSSPVSGTFKAFLWKEDAALDPDAMVAVFQVDAKVAEKSVATGEGKILTPEEAKGGMSYAEAASIRLPPESK